MAEGWRTFFLETDGFMMAVQYQLFRASNYKNCVEGPEYY